MSAAYARPLSSEGLAKSESYHAVSQRFLLTALAIAASTHLLTIGSVRLFDVLTGGNQKSWSGPIEIMTVPGSRAPVVPPAVLPSRSSPAVATDSRRVPEPVPDQSALASDTDVTVPGAGDDIHSGSLGAASAPASDSVIIPGDGEATHPAPGTFVYFEEPPRMMRMPAVVYPDIARDAGLEGTVIVEALLSKTGRVLDTRITQPVGLLNDAALQAVRSSVWRPAMDNNHPVEVWVKIPIRFSLHE